MASTIHCGSHAAPEEVYGYSDSQHKCDSHDYILVTELHTPSPILNQLKRVAAFQNPEFYKKQSMRLSTAMTPRVISCAEEFPDHVALLRRRTSWSSRVALAHCEITRLFGQGRFGHALLAR